MKVKKLICTISFAFWSLMLVNGVRGQSNFVKVSFEIDGKRVEERFKILIYVDGMTIEPLRFENGFVVPNMDEGGRKGSCAIFVWQAESTL